MIPSKAGLIAWVRFILWPPIVLLMVACVTGFLIAGLPGEAFAGCLWLLLMIRAPRQMEPVLEWYEGLWPNHNI